MKILTIRLREACRRGPYRWRVGGTRSAWCSSLAYALLFRPSSPFSSPFSSLPGPLQRRWRLPAPLGLGFSAALVAHGIVYNHPVDMTRWMVECGYYDGRNILSIGTSLNEDHNGLLVWNFLCWVTREYRRPPTSPVARRAFSVTVSSLG